MPRESVPTATVDNGTVTLRKGKVSLQMTTEEFGHLVIDVAQAVDHPDPPQEPSPPDVVAIGVAGQEVALSLADAESLHRSLGQSIREKRAKQRPDPEEKAARRQADREHAITRIQDMAAARGLDPSLADQVMAQFPERMPGQAILKQLERMGDRVFAEVVASSGEDGKIDQRPSGGGKGRKP